MMNVNVHIHAPCFIQSGKRQEVRRHFSRNFFLVNIITTTMEYNNNDTWNTFPTAWCSISKNKIENHNEIESETVLLLWITSMEENRKYGNLNVCLLFYSRFAMITVKGVLTIALLNVCSVHMYSNDFVKMEQKIIPILSHSKWAILTVYLCWGFIIIILLWPLPFALSLSLYPSLFLSLLPAYHLRSPSGWNVVR